MVSSSQNVDVGEITKAYYTISYIKTRFIAEIILSPIIVKEQRKVYSMMGWLGDMGGLFDALTIILSVGTSLYARKHYSFGLV